MTEVESENKSSRKMSRRMQFGDDCESMDYYDGDFEPTVKKLKAKSAKTKNKVRNSILRL